MAAPRATEPPRTMEPPLCMCLTPDSRTATAFAISAKSNEFNGRRLVVVATNSAAQVWDLSGLCTPVARWDFGFGACSFHPKALVLVGVTGGKLVGLDVQDPERPVARWSLPAGPGAANDCVISRTGEWVVAVFETVVRLWRVQGAGGIGEAGGIRAAGQLSVAAGVGGAEFNACDVSGDDTRVATASDDACRLWSLDTLTCLATLRRHTDSVTCCAFSADSGRLATGSSDGTVHIWDVGLGRDPAFLLQLDHGLPIQACVFSPVHARVLATSCGQMPQLVEPQGASRLWHTDTGQVVAHLNGRVGSQVLTWAGCLQFSDDGGLVAGLVGGVFGWVVPGELGRHRQGVLVMIVIGNRRRRRRLAGSGSRLPAEVWAMICEEFLP